MGTWDTPPTEDEIRAAGPAPGTWDTPPTEAELEEVGAPVEIPVDPEEERNRRLTAAFRDGLQSGAKGNREAIYAVANATKAPIADVERAFPDFQRAAELSKFDPVRFRRDNPALEQLLLSDPALGAQFVTDQKLSWYARKKGAIRAWEQSLLGDTGKTALDFIRGLGGPMADPLWWVGPALAVTGAIDEPDAKKTVTQKKEGLDTGGMIADTFGRQRQQAEAADLAARMMVADNQAHNVGIMHQRGIVTDATLKEAQDRAWELRKRVYEIQRELGAQPDYGQSEGQQMLLDVTEGVASQVSTLRGLGAGAAAGAVLGAVGGALATRSPVGARIGAGQGLGIGAKVGTFLSSWSQEAGNTYQELLEAKDSDGNPVDPAVARGLAMMVGLANAGIELTTEFGVLKGGASAKALLASKSWRALALDVGRSLAAGGVSESGEEFVQEGTGILGEAIAKTASSGKAEDLRVDLDDAAERMAQAQWKGFAGGVGIGGAMSTLGAVSYVVDMERSARAAATVRELAGISESKIAQAAPVEAAKIARAAAAQHGGKIDGVWIDPQAFVDQAKAAGLDPEAVAEDVFGAGGARRLEEALKRRTIEPGGRAQLELKPEEYLEKLGPTPLAKALVDHMTVIRSGKTAAELVELNKSIAKEVAESRKRLAEEVKREGGLIPKTEQEQRLLESVRESLTKAGEDPDVIEETLATHWAVNQVMAKRMGISVEEMHAMTAARFERATKEQEAAVDAATSGEAMQAAWRTMTPAEKELAYFTDRNTGLLTKRGALTAARDPNRQVLHEWDLEGKKFLNDEFGHESVDGALRVMAEVVRRHIPDAWVDGGSIRGFVKDQAQAEQIAVEMRQAVDPRLQVTTGGAVVEDLGDEKALGAALEAHKAAKGGEFKAGRLGHRLGVPSAFAFRGVPVAWEQGLEGVSPESAEVAAMKDLARKGLAARAAELSQAAITGTVPMTEAHGEAFAQLTDQEAFEGVYRDADGLLTAEGFRLLREVKPKRFAMSADLRGFKQSNQAFGRAGTDALASLFSQLLVAAGAVDHDMARPHGDEFLAQTDDHRALWVLLRDFQKYLERFPFFYKVLTATDDAVVDGRAKVGDVAVQDGLQFAYAIDPDLAKADRDGLRDAKSKQQSRPARIVDRGVAGELLQRARSTRGRLTINVSRLVQAGDGLGTRGVGAGVRGGVSQRPAAVAELVAEIARLAGDAEAVKAEVTRPGSVLYDHAVTAQGLIEAAKLEGRFKRKAKPGGKLAVNKPGAWDAIALASWAGEESPLGEADGSYRRHMLNPQKHAKPSPAKGGDLDGLNQLLGITDEAQGVSSYLEAFDRLVGKDLRWSHIDDVVNRMNEAMPGLSLRLPDEIIAQLAEERALEEDAARDAEMVGEDLVDAATGEVLFQPAVPSPQTETPEFKAWFGDSKVVDEQGRPLVVYHGAKRPDRIGARFRKTRATSGPMAFFTDSGDIAGNYAMSKSDTSFEPPSDYSGWFKMKVGRSEVDLDRAWWFLKPEQRKEIAEKLPHVIREEETNEFRLGGPDEFGLADKGHWEHELRAARGNVLMAAKETWLQSAGLFDEEELFLKILELGGAKELFAFETPWAEYPAVFPVFLAIQNPLDTHAIPEDVLEALDKKSRRTRSKVNERGADFWDKNTRDPREWMRQLREDIAQGVDTVWTSIPDWVTGVLKEHGYDGIRDLGGKFSGGEKHAVWIPFDDKQVKSATGNRGTFDPKSPNILKSERGRAARGWVNLVRDALSNSYKVMLTKHSDPTTPVHELSHIYLEMLGDIAARADAPKQVKDDWSRALKFLGVNSRAELDVAAKERWAKAWEAYLMEGKAPSPALVVTFQRFRAWFLRVYRTVKALGVELDDDIRGVFDRMLATDEEIASARAELGRDTPAFLSAEAAGVPQDEFDRYQQDRQDEHQRAVKRMQSSMARTMRAVMTDEWAKERAKFVDEAGAEFDRRADVRAWRYVRHGEMTGPDGKVLEDLSGKAVGKLDSGAVKRMLRMGSKLEGRLRGRLVKGGEDPAEVASRFGFAGPQELLAALANVPDRREWVNDRAEMLAAAARPELAFEYARVVDLARRAYHGADDAMSLVKELEWMHRQGKVAGMPPIRALELHAKDLVGQYPVRRMRTGDLARMERRAAERSVAAIKENDWPAATAAKREQIVAHFMYRELDLALQDRERFETLVRELSNRKRREVFGRAGQRLLDGADQILEAMGVREKPDEQTAAERMPLLELVPELSKLGYEVGFEVGRLSMLVMEPPEGGWLGLTVQDMRLVADALSQLYQVARDVNSLIVDGRRRTLENVVADIASEASLLPSKGLGPLSVTAGGEGVQKEHGPAAWLTGLAVGLRKRQEVLRRLGPTAYRVLWTEGAIEARNAEDALTETVTKVFTGLWDKLPKAMKARRYEALTDLEGVPIPVDFRRGGRRDRVWMWMVALNMGNRGNMQRLLDGYEWGEAEVRNWLNRNMTPEEWQFVQGVWDLLDRELWPLVAKVHQEVNGLEPEKIEASEFVTPHGVFRGGYFPARYDPDDTELGSRQAEEVTTKMFGEGRASVLKGFTKQRAALVKERIDLHAWDVMPAHVASVVHYVTHERFVRDSAKLVWHKGFKATVAERLGKGYVASLQDWLKTTASWGASSVQASMSTWYRLVYAMRMRGVISTLSWSIPVVAADFYNPIQTLADGQITARGLAHAAARTLPLVHWKETRRRALELSPELRHRDKAMVDSLRRQLGEVGRQGQGSRLIEGARKASWFLQDWSDKLSSTVLWVAAYDDAVRQERADPVAWADDVVHSQMPSHDVIDQAPLAQDRGAFAALVTFYGYFSARYNQTLRVWEENSAPEAMARILAGFAVMSLLAEITAGRGPGEDEEPEEWVTRKMLAAPFTLLPVVGGVAEEATNQATSWLWSGEAKHRPYSPIRSPVYAAGERLVRSVQRMMDDEAGLDAYVLGALDVLGLAVGVGIGSSQVQRTGRYLASDEGLAEDLEQGDIPGVVEGLGWGDREGRGATLLSPFTED